jgi:Nif-specific regulatory protein
MPSLSLEESVNKLEKAMLIDRLKHIRCKITQAAATLKRTVRKIAYKAKRYDVNYRDCR